MNIKLRKQNKDGILKVETKGDIKEVQINEDFMKPNEESIAVCFKGKESSGIVEFSPQEIEQLYNSVKQRTHLIKGIKIFKE